MRLPVLFISRGDILGIIIGVLLLALILCITAISAGLIKTGTANNGFGPGWSCESIPKAGQVCVKNVPARP